MAGKGVYALHGVKPGAGKALASAVTEHASTGSKQLHREAGERAIRSHKASEALAAYKAKNGGAAGGSADGAAAKLVAAPAEASVPAAMSLRTASTKKPSEMTDRDLAHAFHALDIHNGRDKYTRTVSPADVERTVKDIGTSSFHRQGIANDVERAQNRKRLDDGSRSMTSSKMSDVNTRHWNSMHRARAPENEHVKWDEKRMKLETASHRADTTHSNNSNDVNSKRAGVAQTRLDEHTAKLRADFRAANPAAAAKAESLESRSLTAGRRGHVAQQRRQRVEGERKIGADRARRADEAKKYEADAPARAVVRAEADRAHAAAEAASAAKVATINKGRVADAQPKFKAEFQRLAKQGDDTRAQNVKTRSVLGKTGKLTEADHHEANWKSHMTEARAAISSAPKTPGHAHIYARNERDNGFAPRPVPVSKQRGGLFSHKTENGTYAVSTVSTGSSMSRGLTKVHADRIVMKAGGSRLVERTLGGDKASGAKLQRYTDLVQAKAPHSPAAVKAMTEMKVAKRAGDGERYYKAQKAMPTQRKPRPEARA